MIYKKVLRNSLIASVAMAMVPSSALAGTVTGTVAASIVLTNACEVNTSTGTTSVNFGALSFGSHTTLFTEAEAEIGGATSLAIKCSPGLTPTLKFGDGLNDGLASGGSRAMKFGSFYVPYDIYDERDGSTALTPATAAINVARTGGQEVLSIMGRAIGAAGLEAGTYTDTIAVTLTF